MDNGNCENNPSFLLCLEHGGIHSLVRTIDEVSAWNQGVSTTVPSIIITTIINNKHLFNLKIKRRKQYTTILNNVINRVT